jgi:hypothetical protein
VFNVLFVGYSLAKNNLNNSYQYIQHIKKKYSKTINYLLNYINKIQGESFFVRVSVFSENLNLPRHSFFRRL